MKCYDVKSDVLILHAAMRYALGRSTYMVAHICNNILMNWNELEMTDKEMFVSEIKIAIKSNRAGTDIDVRDWQKIIDRFEKEK